MTNPLHTGLNRRQLLTRAGLLAAGVAIPATAAVGVTRALGTTKAVNPRPDRNVISPAYALKLLKDGNARYVKNQSPTNVAPQLPFTSGQWPFAAIVTCADSRVQPDEIFALKPGNLFVVRNAGNVIDDDVLGTLEYGVEHLGISAIVVMGHTSCGAVKATDASIASNTMPGGHVDSLVNHIKPALQHLPAGHTLTDAVKANAAYQKTLTVADTVIDEAEKAGEITVVSAMFDLETKKVVWSV